MVAPLAGFRAQDHLGEPDRGIRENVDRYLAVRGIDLRGGRVLMLTSARVFGYVFNPLTVFWCRDETGSLACVIAEVHNTYGERHCYLIRPDGRARATVDKEFYVSPFNDLSGRYRMSLPEPDSDVCVAIALWRDGKPVLTTSLAGPVQPVTTGRLLGAATTMPLAPLQVAAKIRVQGIRLWARGLPITPRPKHHAQEAV